MGAEEYKQVMVVRRDLHMGCGKIAVQVAHASIGAYEACKRERPEWVKNWIGSGWKKIAVKVNSEEELKELMTKAKRLSIPYSPVLDAGLTQVSAGTLTCVGFGPAPASIIDQLTGDLKLL